MHHETPIDIAASPGLIWSTLSDVARWPEWNPSVTEVERLDAGEFGVGSRARVKQPGMPHMVWEVTEHIRGELFIWVSRMPGVTTTGGHRVAPGTNSGESGEDFPADRATVTLSLDHEGFLAPLVWRLTGSRTRRYVQMEAEGLKRRCESGGG